MITLDIKKVINKIKKLEDTSTKKYESGIQYLYDRIYSTLIEGKDIRIGDIDFNRFSTEEYESFYNKVITEESCLDELYSVFNKSVPCNASESKVFF